MASIVFREANLARRFPTRSHHRGVVFNGGMYITGGRDLTAGNYYNDVWYTQNGWDWREVFPNAAESATHWARRCSHGMAVFNNRMYIYGGILVDGSYASDCWSSLDGLHWERETRDTGFAARYDGELCAHDNRLFMIGGAGVSQNHNDVWHSINGRQWTRVLNTGHGQFPPVMDHKLCNYNSRLWIIGGVPDYGTADFAIHSQEGRYWTQINNCAFGDINNHMVVPVEEMQRVFVLLGSRGGVNRSEVWHSQDCVDWRLGNPHVEYGNRDEAVGLYFDGRIWVIGGIRDGVYMNDVWYADGLNFRV